MGLVWQSLPAWWFWDAAVGKEGWWHCLREGSGLCSSPRSLLSLHEDDRAGGVSPAPLGAGEPGDTLCPHRGEGGEDSRRNFSLERVGSAQGGLECPSLEVALGTGLGSP